LATTTNAGTIRTTADTGAAASTGGIAQWAFAGNNVVNNTGEIVGGISTNGSLSYGLNNQAGGVWTPSAGTNTFGGSNDAVNNAGLINVRAGTTTFAGLETFNNQAGGVVNLAYNSAATDNLVTQNLSAKSGSVFNFNVDMAAASNAGLGYDNTANGRGTADTVVVTGTSTPSGRSTVNLTIAGGAPTSQTGSVALIYTGVNLAAPTAGARITSSSYYTFGSGVSSGGATAYYLVDDGNGGLYLQWAPNVSATALGAFGGATGTSAKTTPGAALAGGAAASTGTGGVGYGGGPTGGGVLGRIGDMAASSVLGTNSAVQVGIAQQADVLGGRAGATTYCQQKKYIQTWGQVEGEKTSYKASGGSFTESLAGGVEVDAGEASGLGCGRLGFGIFSVAGRSGNTTDTGSGNANTTGLGGYIRATSAFGIYGSLLAATSWSDTKLGNTVYGSTAEKHSKSVTVAATTGYVAKLGSTTALDVRAFASYNTDRSNGFLDSVGIAVSNTRDDIRTYGLSVGLHQALSPNVQGFVRAGIKRSDLDSSITAFDNTATGSVGGLAKTIEAGVTGSVGNGIQIGVSTFGTFSQGTTGVGGRATVGVRF
jgi:hypothetical protein